MSNVFVREEFYIEPPQANATPAEWKAWLKKDSAKARGAKAAFTRKQAAQDCDDPRLSQMGMVKLGGVWRQSVALYSGSSEEGTLTREVSVEASQERDLEGVRRAVAEVHRSAGQRRNRNKARRARRNKTRKNKYR